MEGFTLPPEVVQFLVGILTLVVGFLVAQGVKGFLAVFGWDLSGYAAAFTAVVVGALIFFIQGVVGLLPPEGQDLAVRILQLLMMILGMFGVHKTYSGLKSA